VHTLNLGILAHVDAGKTSLTERLLFAAGVVDEMGSVDDGTTQTDTLDLERRRGITIRSAVASIAVGDVTVNIVDTPGHPDFIAEVDRALGVLDGAVLVVSAVEGVQAQTRILFRALRRLRVPTLLFLNKVDRMGADPARVLAEIADRLTRSAVPRAAVTGAGTRAAAVVPLDPEGSADAGLADRTARLIAHPAFAGSALTGAGIAELVEGITTLLPAASGDPGGPLSASVFKVERDARGRRVAWARLFSGTLRLRDRIDGHPVTALRVVDRGRARPATAVAAGQIAQVWGLPGVRVGDPLGETRPGARGPQFAPPTLEAVIVPAAPSQAGPLHAALARLAEQDPLIGVRQGDGGELSVTLYGEVQMEVLRATLAADDGLDVGFRDATTICVERPAGTGRALEVRGRGGNPFAATVGLRIEPAPPGSGLSVRSDVGTGSIPLAYLTAVEETARATLRQGLCGWEVTDCTLTITHCDHRPPPVPVGGFRHLTPLVAMAALADGGTVVCEPVQRFRLEVPDDAVPATLALLGRVGATVTGQAGRAALATLEGEVRAARAAELRREVAGTARGEGVLELGFAGHRQVRGRPPTRPRTGSNPLDRREYLLRLSGRLDG
jgi:ribosomal protection tetracycline resistance protein